VEAQGAFELIMMQDGGVQEAGKDRLIGGSYTCFVTDPLPDWVRVIGFSDSVWLYGRHGFDLLVALVPIMAAKAP
jgi:hypothetical protein